MTDRERELARLGFEYAEGIERASVITVPSTGREIRKTPRGTWECNPWNDNYWKEFPDLLDAIRFATPPRVALHHKRAKLLRVEGDAAEEFGNLIGTAGKFRNCSDAFVYSPDDDGDWLTIVRPEFTEDGDKLRIRSGLGNVYVFRVG